MFTYQFGFVGRPTYLKGYDRLLELSRRTECSFVHFGPKLKNLPSGNLITKGDGFTKEKIYNSFKTLVLLSRSEGFPNIVLEAVQFGKSIILSKENEWLKQIEYINDYIIFVGSIDEIEEFISTTKINYKKPITKRRVEKENEKIVKEFIEFLNYT